MIAMLMIGMVGATFYIQHDTLSAETKRADRAESNVTDRDRTITALKDAAVTHRKALGILQAQRTAIAATLTQREQTIQQHQHENIAIRAWAESAVPDAIARLRHRPAFTGADAYRQRLPASDALHPASKRPDN
ncbi:Rz-like lysis system protein LysB [Glaciimonas sp. PCH181]|uniref:Rz-like lysis system protein LysB n=1 Tax=Glaciimonas sp. PCH181 TaxID=2133943 RepID=UPI001374A168|nr:Rz-like lysis system protein LysB [Glaciimonas sp. PCH181]